MDQEHIKQIFERADLQHICEFLTTGMGLDGPPDKRPYADRLAESSAHIVSRLRKYSADEQEFTAMYDDFGESTVANMNVFLEIGMKVGARIMVQLLFED